MKEASSSSSPSPFPFSNLFNANRQEKKGTGSVDTRRMTRGRKPKLEPSVHALRLQWLITDMEKEGITQSEFSRRTGLGVTLVNKYRNLESSGISGVSAETVQAMRDKLGIDPRLFFDPYEGKRPYALYLLDAKREAAQVADLNQRIIDLNQRLQTSEQANVDLRDQLERRLAALEGLAGKPAPVDRGRKTRRSTR